VPEEIIHGNGGSCAVVQPQEGWTLNMVTLVDETLVKLKVKCASFAPAIIFVALDSLSQYKKEADAMQVLAAKMAAKMAAQMMPKNLPVILRLLLL
jgi:hypothetical protein